MWNCPDNQDVGLEAVSYTHLDVYKRQIQKGMTQDEVEKISRDKLDLASPNERVFINIDG